MRRRPTIRALAILALATVAHASSFVNFESGQVRPLSFVPAADLLFAVNTPGARLAIFRATASGLTALAEVPVGLEPVAVATRELPSGHVEAWVVNHLSDSVSIVTVDPAQVASAHVTRTLLVGDEPRDVLFAGSMGTRAFVTTAHRGAHRPGDPQPLVPGVGRADVWVFDANAPGAALGGTPLAILSLLGDTPRALAATPGGATVYAAVFHSGNGTTSLNEVTVSGGGGLPPPPPGSTPDAPSTGLIVKHDPASGAWTDEIGRDWHAQVPFTLPDYDVFEIDADAPLPVQTGAIAHVGTVLFDMIVRGSTGRLYVANIDARNQVRFEPVVRGNLAQSRITVIGPGTVTPVHLNSHVDYSTVPGPPAEIAQSLAFPLGMAFSADEQKLFVAAFGSGTIGVLDADLLEAGSALPREQLTVGGGPTGIVLDASRDRLYVMNRFDQTIAVVADASSSARALAGTVGVGWDPTPPAVNAGRRFLYDARATSAHGDAACATCHVFGDMDDLAWDLGNPFAPPLVIPGQPQQSIFGGTSIGPITYHPMKGPLLTQSLRGLRDTGPLHWRGDRSAAVAGGDPFDADGNFKTFNVAFAGLLGGAPLDAGDMQAFTDFVLSLRYPPNPFRALDDVPTPEQEQGRVIFTTRVTDAPSGNSGRGCETCHGFPAGTNGRIAFEFNSILKVPHLRNAYQKVGRFGVVGNDHGISPYTVGNQVRGFGLEFNGSLSSLVDFHQAFPLDLQQRKEVSAYVLAFDTGLAAGVGEQLTITSASASDEDTLDRLDLLVARDDAGACELVAHAVVGGTSEAWRYAGEGGFEGLRTTDPHRTTADLVAIGALPGREVTFTCVPPRNGRRYGNDADEDLAPDGDELAAGADPHDPASVPASFTIVPTSVKALLLKDRSVAPADATKRKFALKVSTKLDPASNRIVPPPPAGPGDPRLFGATLIVYNVEKTTEEYTVTLPASGWTSKGNPAAPTGYKYKGTDPQGPVKKIAVGKDKLAISGGHAKWGYSLDEAEQGTIAVRLLLGTGVEWCTGAVTGKVDVRDKFTALSAPPPPACVPF